MARVELNPAIRQIRGAVGDMVYRRGQNGKTHIMKMPNMSKVKWSAAQKEHRRRFAYAVAYAHDAMADEKVCAMYVEEAAQKGKRPFDLAVSDYFKGRNLLREKGIGD
jgi:hypothetical protein